MLTQGSFGAPLKISQIRGLPARGVELTNARAPSSPMPARCLLNSNTHLKTTRRTARGEQGQICVVVTPTAPFVWRVIHAFREAFSRVSLTPEECLTNDLIERPQNEKRSANGIPRRFSTSSVMRTSALGYWPKGSR